VWIPATPETRNRTRQAAGSGPGLSHLARAVRWTSQQQFRGPTIRSQPHPIRADASGPRGGAGPRHDGNQRSAEAGALARFAPHCRRRHHPGRPEDASVLRQQRGARIGPHAAGVTARGAGALACRLRAAVPWRGSATRPGRGFPSYQKMGGEPSDNSKPSRRHPPTDYSSARSQNPVVFSASTARLFNCSPALQAVFQRPASACRRPGSSRGSRWARRPPWT